MVRTGIPLWFWLQILPSLAAGMADAAPDYLEGEVIVTYRSLTPAGQSAVAQPGRITKPYHHLSQTLGKTCLWIRDASRNTASLIAQLRQDPQVERVETNYLRRIADVPNDLLFGNLWALQNTGQTVNGVAGIAGADMAFLPAWAMAQNTTNPVVVAVIDTGVDYTHPDLASTIWTNPGEIPSNGLDDDGNGYVDDYHGYDFADHLPDPQDSGVHGTHVAGTIAATGDNNLGIIGVNYQARIMALRASSDGTSIATSAEIEALEYAILMKRQGVNLVAINASFGGAGANSLERAAIQAAGDAGIVFCAAAGNSGSDNDQTPFYPANYRLTNMIVAAASDPNDQLADFSNFGATTVDLAAPGVNILSSVPVAQAAWLCSVQSGDTTYAANPLAEAGSTSGVTGSVYDCGLGFPEDFPAGVSNNIALIGRGEIYFADKVANAMAAGVSAVIIYNNQSGNFTGTLNTVSNWLPVVSIAGEDGQALVTSLPASATVVNGPDLSQLYQLLSGTSMATPQVAGAVAFAAQNFPAETLPQRIQRVLSNVDVLTNLTGQVGTGGRLNLRRVVDTNLNGIPDWWELANFGSLINTNGTTDTDQVAWGYYQDWLAGINPTNAAAGLNLTLLAVNPDNTTTLAWPGTAGQIYRLQCTTNLSRTPFTAVLTNLVATETTNVITDPNTNADAMRFYRLLVVQ